MFCDDHQTKIMMLSDYIQNVVYADPISQHPDHIFFFLFDKETNYNAPEISEKHLLGRCEGWQVFVSHEWNEG